MKFYQTFNIAIFRSLITIFLTVIFTGCVSVTAERFDEANECWGEAEEVSCEFGDGSGTGAVAFAEGPEGDFWFFDSRPIPDGFEIISEGPRFDKLAEKPSCRDAN